MATAIILIDIFFVLKYKWRHFNYHHNKIEFYLSIIFSILFSGIHKIDVLVEGSLYSVKMGFPFPWMEKYIFHEALFEPMNYFQISEINYQLGVFFINALLIYCLMIGVRRLFLTKGWISQNVFKYQMIE